MREVEILVEVKSSKKDVMKALGAFKFQGRKRVIDIYFVDPLRDQLKPDQRGRLRACFRLRKKKRQTLIAYKKDFFADHDKWLYSDEWETQVENFDIMVQILKNIGLIELVRIENEKYTFTTPDYEIVFEDVRDLGYFLEVEKLNEVADDRVSQTKIEMRKVLSGLGIRLGEEMNAGKPELMLAKKSGKF